jgi:hypothetical protein
LLAKEVIKVSLWTDRPFSRRPRISWSELGDSATSAERTVQTIQARITELYPTTCQSCRSNDRGGHPHVRSAPITVIPRLSIESSKAKRLLPIAGRRVNGSSGWKNGQWRALATPWPKAPPGRLGAVSCRGVQNPRLHRSRHWVL